MEGGSGEVLVLLSLFLVLVAWRCWCTGPFGALETGQGRLTGAVTEFKSVCKEGFRAQCIVSRGGTKCGSWAKKTGPHYHDQHVRFYLRYEDLRNIDKTARVAKDEFRVRWNHRR